MVKIAIAGASGGPSNFPSLPGVTWVQTKYDDKAELVRLLAGVNVVLCFFVVHTDEGARSQKLLIDAAVEAGVPRYIPSEWSLGASLEGRVADLVPQYANKLLVRDYLAALNSGGGKKVLEYTLVWPGLFLNYLGAPHKTTDHVSIFEFIMNIDRGVALAVEGHADSRVAFTTIADLRATVVRIVEYEGEWPVNGGIRGDSMRYADLFELVGRIRGAPLEVSWLKKEDLQAGRLEAGWTPMVDHPAIEAGLTMEIIYRMHAGMTLATAAGGWDTSDEWNKLLPDMKFTGVEKFLTLLLKSK